MKIEDDIIREEADGLEVSPSWEEIKEAMRLCDPTKALGSDGYNLNFIRKMWEEIGDDFCKTVEDFFQTGCVTKMHQHNLGYIGSKD